MANFAFSPMINRDTEEFWKAASEGRLALQRCRACSEFRHPPSPVCHACLTADHEWIDSAGRGKVWSYTIVRAPVEGWPGELPYVVVIVELDEGVKLISNLVGKNDTVEIGMDVEVCFEPGPEGGDSLPKFRLS